MFLNQNETRTVCGHRHDRDALLAARPSRFAFTLTELLVVITIISILAALVVPAIINAVRKANQTAILVEMQQIGAAMETFRDKYGAYPPNCVVDTGYTQAGLDVEKFFRQAFPRQREDSSVLAALQDMNGAEAIFFWLGGFSDDAQYPITGPGGPAYFDDGTPEDLEGRKRLYDFDLSRLEMSRQVSFTLSNGDTYLMNLWTYTPKKSTQPLAYFDCSRHRAQYEASAGNFVNNYDPAFDGGNYYALKRYNATNLERVEFVNQGKFQILHSGLDNDWGEMSKFSLDDLDNPAEDVLNSELITFPEGPFTDELADNLVHSLEDNLANLQD